MARENGELRGKAIVITGASSGFGRGAALAFADAGASVVLAARRGQLLDEIAHECRGRGAKAVSLQTDVSNPEDVAVLAERAISELGSFDVWINNAGVGAIGPFERVPLEDHEQVIATNLLGTLYGSHFAYRHFLERGSGILINVSSELGKYGAPYYASYVAAKHGVVGLGEALRQELEQNEIEDVHVCTVLPTAHDTPFFDHVANYSGHEVQAPEPLHDPENVIHALLRLAVDPRDQEIVGVDGVAKILMKKIAPGVAEKFAARRMHETQMEKAPLTPDSPGAVRAPSPVGTEVNAGRSRRAEEVTSPAGDRHAEASGRRGRR
jgi:NAD(P)-dependent dehydrogenase (short-subunit alcohol dehydrogenase family)